MAISRLNVRHLKIPVFGFKGRALEGKYWVMVDKRGLRFCSKK